VNMTPGIRGINRATVEADTTTGLYVVDASIVVRAPAASDALRQIEEAITGAYLASVAPTLRIEELERQVAELLDALAECGEPSADALALLAEHGRVTP
jgi:hypothetical protein